MGQHFGHHFLDVRGSKVSNQSFAVLDPPALNDTAINFARPVTRVEKIR
jgi:hypothetical protein